MKDNSEGEIYPGIDSTVLPEVINDPRVPYIIRLISGSKAVQDALTAGKLDPLLNDISMLYREVFGGPPWNEYAVCPDGHNTNYQTVFGQDGSLGELEANRPDSYACPQEGCGLDTELFYPPEATLETFRARINDKILTTLAFTRDTGELAGASLGWLTTVGEGWADKMIVGTGDWSPEERQPFAEYMKEAKESFSQIGFPDVDENTAALNSSDWLVGAKHRNSGLAGPLLYAQYASAKKIMGGNAPIVGEALVGSKSHAIFSLGAKMGKKLPTGICRVYSNHDMAMKCLEGIAQKTTLNPRKTHVIECTCSTPLGMDEEAAKTVIGFLEEVAEKMGRNPLRKPEVNLSKLYGFSGWVPVKQGGAVHFYAWRNENNEQLPFISVDISTRFDDIDTDAVADSVKDHFDVVQMSQKTSKNDEGWEDLAPEITRQRMNLTTKLKTPVTPEKMTQVLEGLTAEIEMSKLSDVMIEDEGGSRYSCWMHWESSGVVCHFDKKGNLSIDIYTCKEFDPKAVTNFLKKELGFDRHVSTNF